MSAYPRWLLLELAEATDGVPPSTPPTKHPPKENEMTRMTDKKCSRDGCENRLGVNNKTGTCTPCQQGRSAHLSGERSSKSASPPPAPVSMLRDDDDELLERTKLGSTKPPPPPKKTKAQRHAEVDAAPATWLEKFYRLQEALSLNPDQTLEEWCRDWVEETSRRALENHTTAAKPAEAAES